RGSTPKGGGGASERISPPWSGSETGEYPEGGRGRERTDLSPVERERNAGAPRRGAGGREPPALAAVPRSPNAGPPGRAPGARAKRARIAVSPRTYRTPTERSRPPNAFCSSTLDASTKRGHTAPPQMNRNHLRAQLVLLIPD